MIKNEGTLSYQKTEDYLTQLVNEYDNIFNKNIKIIYNIQTYRQLLTLKSMKFNQCIENFNSFTKYGKVLSKSEIENLDSDEWVELKTI